MIVRPSDTGHVWRITETGASMRNAERCPIRLLWWAMTADRAADRAPAER
jgi:hypothetical protein